MAFGESVFQTAAALRDEFDFPSEFAAAHTAGPQEDDIAWADFSSFSLAVPGAAAAIATPELSYPSSPLPASTPLPASPLSASSLSSSSPIQPHSSPALQSSSSPPLHSSSSPPLHSSSSPPLQSSPPPLQPPTIFLRDQSPGCPSLELESMESPAPFSPVSPFPSRPDTPAVSDSPASLPSAQTSLDSSPPSSSAAAPPPEGDAAAIDAFRIDAEPQGPADFGDFEAAPEPTSSTDFGEFEVAAPAATTEGFGDFVVPVTALDADGAMAAPAAPSPSLPDDLDFGHFIDAVPTPSHIQMPEVVVLETPDPDKESPAADQLHSFHSSGADADEFESFSGPQTASGNSSSDHDWSDFEQAPASQISSPPSSSSSSSTNSFPSFPSFSSFSPCPAELSKPALLLSQPQAALHSELSQRFQAIFGGVEISAAATEGLDLARIFTDAGQPFSGVSNALCVKCSKRMLLGVELCTLCGHRRQPLAQSPLYDSMASNNNLSVQQLQQQKMTAWKSSPINSIFENSLAVHNLPPLSATELSIQETIINTLAGLKLPARSAKASSAKAPTPISVTPTAAAATPQNRASARPGGDQSKAHTRSSSTSSLNPRAVPPPQPLVTLQPLKPQPAGPPLPPSVPIKPSPHPSAPSALTPAPLLSSVSSGSLLSSSFSSSFSSSGSPAVSMGMDFGLFEKAASRSSSAAASKPAADSLDSLLFDFEVKPVSAPLTSASNPLLGPVLQLAPEQTSEALIAKILSSIPDLTFMLSPTLRLPS
ncbi:MAG: hypothetical protein Q8P67_11515 [archaeon]|nr:hypothetical protein [archaeon]